MRFDLCPYFDNNKTDNKKMQNVVKKEGRVNDLATSVLVVLIGSPLAVFLLFLVTVFVKQVLFFFN